MEASYRREMGINCLVLQAEGEDEHFSRILTENAIPGLLPVRISRVDNTREYYYELRNCISLTRRYARDSIGREAMRDIVTGIRDVLSYMDRYLLDAGGLLLDPELVFVDADTEQVRFCCMPGREEPLQDGLQKLAGFFIKKIDHQDEGSTSAAYELVRLCAQEYTEPDDLCAVFGDEVAGGYIAGETVPLSPGLAGSALIGLSADPPAWINEEGSRNYLGEKIFAGTDRRKAAGIFEVLLPVLGCVILVLLHMSGLLDPFRWYIRVPIYLLIAAATVCLTLLAGTLRREDPGR